jgi:hypothetical protein
MVKIAHLFKPALITLAILTIGIFLSVYLKEDVLEYVLMHSVMGVAAFVALATRR